MATLSKSPSPIRGQASPKAFAARYFDPFLTTKEVGKGTGQGLALARAVVVDKHGGTLTFETELGKGTSFRIRLPLATEDTAELAPIR
jgi:signal transduction histidine kinase